MNHSLELERVWKDYNDAQEKIKDIPGDLGNRKKLKLEKIKPFIILADRRFAEGAAIGYLIDKISREIDEVLKLHLEKETIIPPPYRPVELWEQLDLPFNKNK